MVLSNPKVGSRKKPAKIAPRMAPLRLYVYKRVTDVDLNAFVRTSTAASTGNVIPISVVGTSSVAPESTKRHRLKR